MTSMRTTDFSSSPMAPVPEQRQHLRFDKMFAVRIESLLFGESVCVARNVSAGGMLIRPYSPLAVGTAV